MNQRLTKWAKFTLRWGIAIVGITLVVRNMYFRDRVTFLDDRMRPVQAAVASRNEADKTYRVVDPRDGKYRMVGQDELVNQPDQQHQPILIQDGRGTKKVYLLALDLSPDLKSVQKLLVADAPDGHGRWIAQAQTVNYQLKVPHPLVEIGVATMVREAWRQPSLLLLSVFIFPITFLLTSVRWHELLKALEIRIGPAKALVLTMVGGFYNTFMPGSTGGDLLKAIYVAKFTPHRTRAVFSVIVDRVIGLLALVILGGVMATYQVLLPHPPHDPVARACLKVAGACGAILLAAVVGLGIFYNPFLRKYSGLDFILRRLPMQKQVTKAVEAMHIYRRKPLLVFTALLLTFPVHITVVLSAMFAGMAFGLPLHPLYYWVAVPVIVLVAAIPISPQGAGVMEYFAIILTRAQGATISQAFALTMSIRIVQILWNLTGGVFVIRGGFHAPTAREQEELETDESTTNRTTAEELGIRGPVNG
ncbi:MAG: flippase-like domain-containing protein [Phycisphaerales bacterium]|nr:flippase-like domain-containing protein [Phycisphaerales bacterium]